MSRGVNKVILIGNLGADPEVRYMPSGGAVTNIRIATSESWKDKQTGETQERTEWHRITLYNRLAEIAAEYLRKGSKVFIEGSIRTSKWQDQNGQDRFTTEIVASNMQLLDSRAGGNGGSADAFGSNMDNAPPRAMEANTNIAYANPNTGYANGNANNQRSNNQASSPTRPVPVPAGHEAFEDELPF